MASIISVGFNGAAAGNSFAGASTSLSRKSDTSDRRKRFPDVHAFRVFSFLISGLRFLNTYIISEASANFQFLRLGGSSSR